MKDTIAAAATPPARCAVGIVRLSGPEAVAAVSALFRPRRGDALTDHPPGTLVLGEVRDGEGRLIDQALATYSRAPRSYTGEDTAELQCHGSPVVLTLVLEALFALGVRQALPGEFTRRAFLSGKLDLVEAEAVADLIDSETAEAARNAALQLSGALGRRIGAVYDTLTGLMAHFCAVLDYPDEDIDPFGAQTIAEALDKAGKELGELLSGYGRGRFLTGGVPCAIVGRPNAGKSSLLNALAGYERAIVTDIPGTTRDTLEVRLELGGVSVRLIDTAGVRESDDPVERLGVARSRAAMEEASLILVLWDGSVSVTEEDGKLLSQAMALAPTILVRTKADLPSAPVSFLPPDPMPPTVTLSARTGEGLEALETAVAALLPPTENGEGEALLTNARQADAARRALAAVERAGEALRSGMPPDAVLTDVEEALAALGELTGRTVTEDVTNQIFSRFCVGK